MEQEPLTEEDIARLRAATTRRLGNLPLFNRSALKLLTIASDDDNAVASFEAVFRSDPGLAAEVLIVANSAEFGYWGRISSIEEALLVLGLDRARSLASRIAMSFYLRASSRKEVQAVWSHSVATAALAEHVASAGARPAPSAFTAGLLHDVGNLGLLLTSQRACPELIALKFVDAPEAAAFETTLWGIGHTEAGAFLADTWGFPESLRRCIADHHGEVGASDDPLLHVVQLACGLATSLGYPEAVAVTGQADGPVPLLPPDLIRRPDFAPERLHELVAKQLVLHA